MNRLAASVDQTVVTTLRWLALWTALLAVGFSYFGRRLELLEFRPGGTTFDTAVRPICLWLFIAGLIVSFRWEIVGGAIAVFAAAGLAAFATNQLIAPHAALAVAAFGLPAGLWVLIDLIELPTRRAIWGLVAAAVVGVAGYGIGWYAYDRVWGPTHPEAAIAPLPPSPTEWIWAGRTTTSGAEVRAKFSADFTATRLAVATDPGFRDPVWVLGDPVPGFRVVSFVVSGLQPDTIYHYAPEVDGELDTIRSGTFRTFPDGPASFLAAFGACARVGSNGAVFDAIGDLQPLFYGIIGDSHYGDNDVDDLAKYHEVLDLTLTRPAQAALYRSTSVAYVWDDHDYGANDSDADSFARAAAMASYRQYVPSYELAGPFSAVYQAFTVGRVRFVLTDSRAARDPRDRVDDAGKSMLGDEQKAWLKQELADASDTHALVVWVNPVPWIAEVEPGADHWGGYATERRELADHIADNGIDNLVMVSGDAHMAAIDDGTNTNYGPKTEGPGFPLLHAAALDRPGSTKGGPYSEGVVAGGGQFGTLEVLDDGRSVDVVLTARDWQGQTLLEHRFTVPVPPDR